MTRTGHRSRLSPGRRSTPQQRNIVATRGRPRPPCSPYLATSAGCSARNRSEMPTRGGRSSAGPCSVSFAAVPERLPPVGPTPWRCRSVRDPAPAPGAALPTVARRTHHGESTTTERQCPLSQSAAAKSAHCANDGGGTSSVSGYRRSPPTPRPDTRHVGPVRRRACTCCSHVGAATSVIRVTHGPAAPCPPLSP